MNTMWLRRRCTSSCQLKMSSVELVLEEEDLLTLILLRVPWKKLMSFKCVSYKWLSLITSPQFTRLRNCLPLRASGLFIQRPPIPEFRLPCPDKVYFLPLDDPDTTSPFRIPTFAHDPFDPERIRILRSCNGLLLCSTCLFAPHEQLNFYVYNPSTNQLAILPKHPAHTWPLIHCIGLAFDPSKSLHYKVVAFVSTSQAASIGEFHIYSSETGTWRVSVHSFFTAPDMCFDGGVYWHGCIHWLIDLYVKLVPDSALSDCLYFNVDEGRIGTFPRPPIAVESTSERSVYFGESEDHLHFTEVCPYSTFLSVYEMKSDYSEWLIKYQIDLAPVSKVFSEMTYHKACLIDGDKYAVAVLSIIRRENFLEDSFLVLEIPGKAIRYNLMDKTFKVIWDFAVDFSLEQVDHWAFGRLKVWQYIETLS